MPFSRAPTSTVLTLSALGYDPEARVHRHPTPVTWCSIGLLPKATDLTSSVFPFVAGLWRDPYGVEPLCVAAIGALKALPVGLGLPITQPVTF